MAWNLAAAMVGLVAMVMLVVTVLDILRERALARMDLEGQALRLSGTMEDVLQNPMYFLDVEKVDATVITAVRSSTKLSYIRVFRPDGSLLVDTRKPDYPAGRLENGFPLAAAPGGSPVLEYMNGQLEVTSIITAGNQTVGIVRVVFRPDLLEDEIRQIIIEHILQAMALFAITVVLAFLIPRYSPRPLRALAAAAVQIGQGKLDHPVPTGGPVETNYLGASLERMRAELESLYTSLETKVDQRTQELTKTARGLEQEITNREATQESLTLRNREFEAMIETAGIMAGKESFQEKCKAILKNLVRILSLDVATLRTPDQTGENLILEAAAGQLGARRPLSIPLGPGLSGRALSKGEAVIVNDYDAYPWTEPSALAQGVRSGAFLPINDDAGKTLGVISAGSLTKDHFTPERVRLLTAIVDRLGALLNNADLS